MAADRVRAFELEFAGQEPYITAHTSGSTGAPKEIRLSKADMRVSAEATCEFFGIDRDSLISAPLSVDYIAGKMMIVRGIVSGARVVLTEPSNRPDLSGIDGMIDLLAVVPSQVPHIIDNYADRVRNLLIGGAQLPAAVEQRLIGMPFDAYVSYGMTETCSHVALRRAGSPLYRAMPGVMFETDSAGRVAIVADKYSFGSLQTNDIVRLHDPYTFEWLGRADNVINTGGIKVFPEEIERVLSHYISEPIYISGESDDKWGTRVILNIESDTQADIASVMELCRRHLPAHAVPKDIRVHKSFDRTSSNKIIRR